MLESQVEKSCCKYLKKLGYLPIKLYSIVGIPDRLIIGKNQEVFFIEFKSEKGTLKKHQKYFRKLLRSFGFRVMIIKSLKGLRKKLCQN